MKKSVSTISNVAPPQPSTPATEISVKFPTHGPSQHSPLLVDAFKRRGWVFIEAPAYGFVHQRDAKSSSSMPWNVMHKAEKFFHSDEGTKMRYHCPPDFGYYATKNGKKQGLKLLTGAYAAATELPPELWGDLLDLSKTVDAFTRDFVSRECVALFGVKALQRLENVAMIPTQRLTKGDDRGAHGPFGMLDIAFYSNDSANATAGGSEAKESPENDMLDDDGDVNMEAEDGVREDVVGNVAPHTDPGLISISFGSTAPGLEMYDPETEKWFEVPDDKLVLWLGSAASDLSKGRLKPGVHRVRRGDKPRLTMWYEACTYDQVPPTIRKQGLVTSVKQERLSSIRAETPFSIHVKTLRRYGMTPLLSPAAGPRGQLIKIDGVYPSSTVYDILLKISEEEGLPPSKMMLTPDQEIKKHMERASSSVVGVLPSASADGKPLVMEHEKTARDYGLQEGSIVEMLDSLIPKREHAIQLPVTKASLRSSSQ